MTDAVDRRLQVDKCVAILEEEAPWATSPKDVGARMINARAETVATSRAFASSLTPRRCLVPADGNPLAFAGLWAAWRPSGVDAPPLRSAAIVTRSPNALVAELHNRMPVVLAPQAWDIWLDQSLDDVTEVLRLLRPSSPDGLEAYPFSRAVNSVRNNSPELVVAVGPTVM